MFCIEALRSAVPTRQLVTERFTPLVTTAQVSRGSAHGAETYGWTAIVNILCCLWLIRNTNELSSSDAHTQSCSTWPLARCVVHSRVNNDVSASDAHQELSGHQARILRNGAPRQRFGAHRTRGQSHVGLRNQQRKGYQRQRSRRCPNATPNNPTSPTNWRQNACTNANC